MAKIYCSINGKKYKCLICRDFITFTDVNDKEMFLTVDKDNKLSTVLKNPFFHRS